MRMLPVVAVLGLCAAVLAWLRRRNGEHCSPAAVVVVAWGGTFALFLLRLIPFLPISWRAGAVLAIGVGALLLGTVLASRLAPRTEPRRWRAAGSGWWVAGYAVLGIAGTFWYFWLVDQHLGWQMMLHGAARVRYALVTYEIPSRFLFLQFFCMAAPLLAGALVISGERPPAWALVLAALAGSGTLVTTDRTQFFIVLLTIGFMWLYRWGASVSLGRIAGYAGLAAIVLVANFLVVGYWVGKSAEVVGTAPWVNGRSHPEASPSISRAAAYASTAYLYATGSFPAFSAYVDGNHPWTYGAQTLYPLARLSQRLGLITRGVPYPIPDSAVIVRDGGHSIGFNAYTFLYYPYQDFGGVGVAIYSLAVGFLAGLAYERVRRARSSPLHLLVVGQVSMALALSVFVNKFNNTAAWYVFILSVTPFVLPVLLRGVPNAVRRAER